MNSKNKINTKKNMDKLINSLGSLIASAGCRFILYQPEIPKKLVKNNKEKNWCRNHYEKYLITLPGLFSDTKVDSNQNVWYMVNNGITNFYVISFS